jgi:hypothetical protein
MNSGPVTDETLSLQFKRCYHSSGRTDFEYGPRGAEDSNRQLWDEELEPLLQESGDLARQTRRVLGPGSEVGFEQALAQTPMDMGTAMRLALSVPVGARATGRTPISSSRPRAIRGFSDW